MPALAPARSQRDAATLDEDTLLQLCAPLRALALLTPEALSIQSDHGLKAGGQLTDAEVDAVWAFMRAGQRCIAKLKGSTLVCLRRLLSGTRALAKSRSDAFEVGDNVHSSAYELFDKYDGDHDGTLSASEFESAATALLGLESREAQSLLKAVDLDGSGNVDIHEFAVWLHSTSKADTSPGCQSIKPNGADTAGDESSLRSALEQAQAELAAKTEALKNMEETHEEEVEASLDFWRGISKHAVLTIDTKVDLEHSEWIGNGKFGFILKAKRRSDEREVVVKMMGLRWAHIACKEWQQAKAFDAHPNIVDYEEVMLHADNDHFVEKLLKAGYERGDLKSRKKRAKFPDRYICLTQEFMNQGTVQDWMDEGHLREFGILHVMEKVAEALAHMHSCDVTHNDIKPENVMLNQTPGSGAEVIVKLGDLGCAIKSKDTSADYWQYGMTGICMITRESFGSRKFKPELAKEFCEELRQSCNDFDYRNPSNQETLAQVPDLLLRIFSHEMSMLQVSKCPLLQGRSLSERASERPQTAERTRMGRLATVRACKNMGDDH